jgi:hypothetical protein
MIETPLPAGGVRGAGGMLARSRMPRTRRQVNGSPVGVFHPCLESTIAISRSEECTASFRTRSISSGRVPDRFTVLCFDADRQLGARAALPDQLD